MYSLHLLYEHDHVYFIPCSVYAMGHRVSSKVRRELLTTADVTTADSMANVTTANVSTANVNAANELVLWYGLRLRVWVIVRVRVWVRP